MKKRCFIIVALLFAQLGFAQTVKNSLAAQHLKGKVQKIETSIYSNSSSDGKVDTLSPTSKSVDLFDEKGNETEWSYFDKDGLFGSKMVKKYDEKNLNTEEDYSNKSGVMESSTVFKYDEKGNLAEAYYEYIADKSGSSKTLYKYDDNGNNIEEDVYKNDGSFKYKNTYKNDDKGNKIEMDYWHAAEDTIRVKWTFSYNDAGLRQKEDRYTSKGELQIENTFTYENPDQMGNWQTETRQSKGYSKEFIKHLTLSVTKRKITYY